MENKTSLLKLKAIEITPCISVKIPTVGEVLDNEEAYYALVSSLTASAYSYMVPLDDMGIDFTSISDFQLFLILFDSLKNTDMSLIFGELDTAGYQIGIHKENNKPVLYHSGTGGIIDEFVYEQIADALRKINGLAKTHYKAANNEAKKYLLEQERKKQLRRKNKPYQPYLENLVVALVNTEEFKYNYENCMNLSLYNFNQSLQQIQIKINFSHTMQGIYSGTLDASKIDKSSLFWISVK